MALIDSKNMSDEEKIMYVKELLAVASMVKKEMGVVDDQARLRIFAEWDARNFLSEPIEVIKEIEKPLVTPEHVLEYQRYWRMKKRQRKEQEAKENRLKMKVKQALERKTARCFICHLNFKPENPTHKIVTKRSGRKHLVIVCTCPKCGRECRSWGGYYDG